MVSFDAGLGRLREGAVRGGEEIGMLSGHCNGCGKSPVAAVRYPPEQHFEKIYTKV